MPQQQNSFLNSSKQDFNNSTMETINELNNKNQDLIEELCAKKSNEIVYFILVAIEVSIYQNLG